MLAGLLLQRTEWTVPEGEAVTVAVVQPNVPLKEKWDPRYRNGILSDFGTRSTALAQEHNLIVWPESALPGYRDRLLNVIERVDQQVARLDSTLITGIPTRDTTGRYNSITALGAGSGTYHKQKLVPFGEYVPLERWLRGAIAFFDLPMSQFAAGETEQRPLLAGNLPVAPSSVTRLFIRTSCNAMPETRRSSSPSVTTPGLAKARAPGSTFKWPATARRART